MEQVPTVDLRDPSATSWAELDRACRDHGYRDLGTEGIQISRFRA
jgi:hypothetical protein